MRKIARLFCPPFSFKQEKHIQRKEVFPKYSILLAEDNLLVAHAIKNLLEPQGYRVAAVEDGVKALTYLKSYMYDWALLDIVLPEVDGIDLVHNYRDWEKETNKSYLPIFGLTGYPFKSMERICKEAGMDFLFEKPFKIDDLKIIEDFLK
ncbi:putative sensory box histidine kinase/response regulator [Candidatus Rickettsiella viridis]|uniref:Putative sensory box histidine kinase/response regulator n=1 Tax=Candidatus Rickettsiella viridis TaxID=676208 RepID=A0A2Z5V7I3_9COXI|nr:response regulator [Candidatus Rickettsiella viridis]BBB15377.1 putative sensory box histidine kinase/response regulator [Candidatus Rickettsiella viridis]